MLYSSLLFISFLIPCTFTRFITIQNNGFEADLVDYKYGSNSYDYGPIQNWDPYDPNNVMESWTDGIVNPTDGTSFNDSLFGDSAPEGTLIAYLNPDGHKKGGVFGLHQTVTAHTITANTTYTLTVWIGNPATNTWSQDSKGSGTYENEGFEPYTVQLVAAGSDTVLAQDNNSLSIPDGEWRQSRVIFDVLQGNPHTGDTFDIRLLWSTDAVTKLSIYLDDVRLEAVVMNATQSPTNQAITTTHVQSTSHPTSPPTVEPTNQPITTTSHPTAAPTNNPVVSSTVTMSPTVSAEETTESTSSSTVSLSTDESTTSSTDESTTSSPNVATTSSPNVATDEITTSKVTDVDDSTQIRSKHVHVDWLAIILAVISGVACCAIAVVAVCFIHERNKQRHNASDTDTNATENTNDPKPTTAEQQTVEIIPGDYPRTVVVSDTHSQTPYTNMDHDENTVGVTEIQRNNTGTEIVYNNNDVMKAKETTNGDIEIIYYNNSNNAMKGEANDESTESEGLWEQGSNTPDAETKGGETKGGDGQEPGLHFSTKGLQ